MLYLAFLAFAWTLGGLFFIREGMTTAPNDSTTALAAGLRRGEVGAFVALAAFVAVWPAVWIGANFQKWGGR